MIPKGLFTQIALMVVAVAIIITYVKPTIQAIGQVQDEIQVYEEERKKVITVNSQLASLRSKMESVSSEDKLRLLTYIPDSIDEIKVQRDLYLMTTEAGVTYNGVVYESSDKTKRTALDTSKNMPIPHLFSLTVEGTYNQIKDLIGIIEQNHYPLEIHELIIKRLEGGFLNAEFDLVTYSKNDPAPAEPVNKNQT